MKNVFKALARAALGLAAVLALGASCPAFAAESGNKSAGQSAGQFRVEQAYVNAPDARIYFYALQGDGTSYAADVVGLAGLQMRLNDQPLNMVSVMPAADDPVTYLYVLDTNVKRAEFLLMERAVLQHARTLRQGDQLIVYTVGQGKGEEVVEQVASPDTDFATLRDTLNSVEFEEEPQEDTSLENDALPDEVNQMAKQLDDIKETLSELSEYVAKDRGSGISQTVTRAGEYVNEQFPTLNARKVMFLFTETGNVMADTGLMGSLKASQRLGALGFSIYGFSFEQQNTIQAGMLQWICGYDESLLTGVTKNTFMTAYKSRRDALERALVTTTVVDKGLMDRTEKTITLSVPSLGVSSEVEVMMMHELESPAIRDVRHLDQTHIRVDFNEAVDGAASTKAYILKDGMGRRLTIKSAEVDKDQNSVKLTVKPLYDGTYTMALRSGRITDKSSEANKCDTGSVSFNVDGNYAKDFGYYWGLVRGGVLLLLAAVVIYTLLGWNERRKDRREETVAQAEAYLSGEENAVLAGNDPQDGDPHVGDASLPLNELQSRVVTLMISINKNITNRMEISIVSSYILGSAFGQCDLRIDDPQVSAQHCVLEVTPTGLAVQDLDSRYGTFVNGKRIREAVPLAGGALLTLGRTRIKVKYSNANAGLHTEEKA